MFLLARFLLIFQLKYTNPIMKKVISFAVVGFLSLPGIVLAQDYAFRVLANKGANEVKSGNTWQPIKTGVQLKKGDELKISENASIGLVHISGRPMEVKQPGNYKVEDLDKKAGAGGTSVLNKYTDFILSSNSAEAKKNRLSATGAVHRGIEDIKVLLPESQNGQVFDPHVVINWETKKDNPPYIVVVKSMFGDVLSETETPEKGLQLDLSDAKYSKENPVLIEVRAKAEGKTTPTSYSLTRLTGDRYANVKKQLDSELIELNEETAFNEYIKASVFEGKKLLVDAIACYQKAMKLDPENPTYKEGYEEFLFRNKIKSEK